MENKNRHLSEEEILEISKKAKGKTFGDLGLKGETHKGGLGNFVEENVFKYSANNDSNPDFTDAGIELKVTPIKQNKNKTFSAKERLVLNKINYKEEATKTFETSSFYIKNKKLLIWFYLYLKGENPVDYRIEDYEIFEFEKTPYLWKIKKDWETIHTYIADGRADLINESLTEYLAACTKGVDGSELVEQYNSDVPAKPRAYSFKTGFMTAIYRQIIHEISPYSQFISDDEWMKNSLEEAYKEKLNTYKGKSIKELKRIFNIRSQAKHIGYLIAAAALGFNGKDNNSELFETGIKVKTVRLDINGVPHESMSFPAFDFTELVNTKWEESEIREDFVDWKIMFFVYQDEKKDCNIEESKFKEVLFWNVPNDLIDTKIKDMYEYAANLIRSGDALYFRNGKVKDRFPKDDRNSNGVCHIRPHGRNKKDQFKLPVVDNITGLESYTKQSFWFNKSFIENLIKKLEEIN